MLIDTRTKSRAYGRHQKQGLWKALRFCAFFCLDLASLATLCRGLAPQKICNFFSQLCFEPWQIFGDEAVDHARHFILGNF